MQGFRTWLGEAIQAVKQGKLGPGKEAPLRVVMGNTSCDVDSAVGSLAMGYYYSKKFNQMWIPVINSTRADFYCNLEIVLHLKNCGLSQDDLYFYDEFRAQFPDPAAVEELALIDHNELDVAQQDLGSKVTHVIDHHVDSGAYKDQLKFKICCFVGSACSLLALEFKKDQARDPELAAKFAADLERSADGSANLAYLLAAAVCLDTYFFKESLKDSKWNAMDSEAHEWLLQYADVGQPYWSALNAAKFDVVEALKLGLRGIFIRDYKNYSLASGIMGVAVSTGSYDQLTEHFGQQAFADECANICVDRNLGLFVCISISVDQSGVSKKDLTFFRPSQGGNALTAKYDSLQALCEGYAEMQLSNKRVFGADALGGKGDIVSYTLGNPAYTRKKYEKVVKESDW